MDAAIFKVPQIKYAKQNINGLHDLFCYRDFQMYNSSNNLSVPLKVNQTYEKKTFRMIKYSKWRRPNRQFWNIK